MAPRAPVAPGEPQVARRGCRAARARERAVDLAEVRGEESPRRGGEERAAEEHLEPQRVDRRVRGGGVRGAPVPRPRDETDARRRGFDCRVRGHHRDGGGADAQLHGAVLVPAVLDPAQRQDVRLGSGGGGLPVPVPEFLRQLQTGRRAADAQALVRGVLGDALRGRLETRLPHVHMRRAGVLGEHRVRGVAQVPLLARRRGRHHRGGRRRHRGLGQDAEQLGLARRARRARRRAHRRVLERAARTRGHALRLARQAERAPGIRARRVQERRRRDRRRRRCASRGGGGRAGGRGGGCRGPRRDARRGRRRERRRRRRGIPPRGGGG